MTSEGVASPKIIQATIIVYGRVQQVGYRKKINHFAQGLGLRGFVENMSDPSAKDERHQPVGIVCQGGRETIGRFVELMKIRNGYIDVEKVVVSYQEKFEVVHQDFYILRREAGEELGPRVDVAIEVLKSMDEGIRSGNKELKEEIRNGNKELKEEISQFRQESREDMSVLKDGMTSLKDGMTSLKDETSLFREESNTNFQSLDGKYHTVTDELKRIRKAVEGGLAIEEAKVKYSARKKK